MSMYFNGQVVSPTLEIPHDIYDSATNSGATITLSETNTIYVVKPTEATTLSFVTTNLRFISTKYVTFMLVLDMTDGLQTITWPSTVQWGNISPTMTANAKYMFSFTKPAGENVWIGNQMFSWQ